MGPDLDGLLKAMGGGEGWGDLENLEVKAKKQLEVMRASALEQAQMIDAALSTHAGKKLLEWLLSVTLNRPGWRGEAFESLDKVTAYGLFRDGQNSIAWTIIEAIAQARGEETKRGD